MKERGLKILEFYVVYKETYHNGVLVGESNPGHCFRDSAEVQEKTVYPISWENLYEMAEKIGGLGMMIFSFRKGRQVSFNYCSWFKKDYRDVKEWKSPLNVEVHETYRKIKPSLKQLINWYNCDEASQYMKEHRIIVG